MILLKLDLFYFLCGLGLIMVAVTAASDPHHPRRIGSALFWSILGFIFMAGHRIPDVVTGYLVIAVVLLAALGQVKPSRRPDVRAAEADLAAANASHLVGKCLPRSRHNRAGQIQRIVSPAIVQT